MASKMSEDEDYRRLVKAGENSLTKVIHEGWMARCRRRKICRSCIHMRYFVLGSRLLSYYRRRPQGNELCFWSLLYVMYACNYENDPNESVKVPVKAIQIDRNCRVEDRGLKVHHGHVVYSLSIHNKKEKPHRITMSSFNIQDAQMWKEKIEFAIDQNSSIDAGANSQVFYVDKSTIDNGVTASSSDPESQYSVQDDDVVNPQSLSLRTTTGNGLPEPIVDWTQESEAKLSNQNTTEQVSPKMRWRLVRCQNGLRIFEDFHEVDYHPRTCSRAMKAIGVVEASCEAIFQLVMNMDGTRFDESWMVDNMLLGHVFNCRTIKIKSWDCSFQQGRLIEEVDQHTAILHQKLQLDWFPMLVWPRDLCYMRYWRHNNDGSYVVLFRSKEHLNCVSQPGFVRAHIESGGYVISPLKPRNGITRSRVQHHMQIDLKGWVVGSCRSFQQHCLLQMLNSVAGLREWFSQTDQMQAVPRISVMTNMNSDSAPPRKDQISQETNIYLRPLDNHMDVANKNSVVIDDYFEDGEELQIAEPVQKEGVSCLESNVRLSDKDDEDTNEIDLSGFSGNLRWDDQENGHDCWSVPDGNNFTVRGNSYLSDKCKIPAGKYLMELVAVDWFKDMKRMDHVARRQGCAVQVASEKGLFSLAINLQVPGSTHYSMVLYFVMKDLVPGSLLQHFVDGDDEFRNSRLKLIPSVRKGSWLVRQSVGSTPCLLGKALDCSYIRGSNYLEIDVNIGSSAVAKGVLGLVCGAITSLVVDIAFLVQANTQDELPEQIIGAVRGSHIELSSAVVLETDDSQSGESSN